MILSSGLSDPGGGGGGGGGGGWGDGEKRDQPCVPLVRGHNSAVQPYSQTVINAPLVRPRRPTPWL